MARHLRWETLPLVVAFTLGGQLAHADIYTWVDASGATHVSNLSPPEGARVTRITHENPQKPVRADTARDAAHDVEIQALSDRVQQLQREVDLARTYAPPPQPMAYPAISPPPPPAPAYAVDDMSASANPCDPVFGGCGYWGQPFYPANIVVVRAPAFRRAYSFHAMHHFAPQRPAQRPMQRPAHPSGGMHRR